LNMVVSTIGLASYDEADDANLDTLDAVIAELYSRKDRIDKLKTRPTMPAAASLEAPRVVQPEPAHTGDDGGMMEADDDERGRVGVESYRGPVDAK